MGVVAQFGIRRELWFSRGQPVLNPISCYFLLSLSQLLLRSIQSEPLHEVEVPRVVADAV